MTDCPACELYAIHPSSGRVNAACQLCRIRDLAAGPWFHASMKAGSLLPGYTGALRAEFGADWKAGHEKVKAAAAAMKSGGVE